ncbi:MAG: 6-bladed beta-propeller [Geothermobacteraceae bacterium]
MIRWLWAVLLLGFALSGCSLGPPPDPNWAQPDADLVWPPPPDVARIRYLNSFDGFPDSQEQEKGGFFSWLTGAEAEGVPLLSPYGVVADGRGRVWVTDPLARRLVLFDLARRRVVPLERFDNQGLESPLGVAYDARRERLYISDGSLGLILVVSADGRLQDVWKHQLFQRPAGLALDTGGQLHVADVLLGEVLVFSPEGKLVRRVGSLLTEDGKFNRPANIAVSADGTLFVVDSINFRVELISADGRSLGSIGKLGDIPGSFARPRGIALDSDGHVYVADAAFGNIQVFDRTGQLLLFFGEPGQDRGQFSLPAGLFFDSLDRLYVVDSYNHRLQLFQYLKAP